MRDKTVLGRNRRYDRFRSIADLRAACSERQFRTEAIARFLAIINIQEVKEQ